MGKRQQNERKFGAWQDLEDGGRRYSCDVAGRNGWRARYVKEVRPDESTVRFFQEVYDPQGILREVHYKFPTDSGHKTVKGGER